MTHTYAILEISPEAYKEIADKLREAGYNHAFHQREGIRDGEVIDMHGIALQAEPSRPDSDPICSCDLKSKKISNRHQLFCKLYYPAFRAVTPPWDNYPTVPENLRHLL